MSKTCAKWRCEQPTVEDEPYCIDHPPLVDHGLKPGQTECPECGHVGMGTIHSDLWYCGYPYEDGCGELYDPYKLAGVEKRPKWEPGSERINNHE